MKHKKDIIELPQIDFSININEVYMGRKKIKKHYSENACLCGIVGTISSGTVGVGLTILCGVICPELGGAYLLGVATASGLMGGLIGETMDGAYGNTTC